MLLRLPERVRAARSRSALLHRLLERRHRAELKRSGGTRRSISLCRSRRSPDSEFTGQPAPLEAAAFGFAQGVYPSLSLFQKVEERSHRYEPSVLLTESLHEPLKCRGESRAVPEFPGEMCVHDTGTALGLELVRVGFASGPVASSTVGTFRRRKPAVHILPIRVMIRHHRAHLQCVDIARVSRSRWRRRRDRRE